MITEKTYAEEIAEYRAARETRLRDNERSWLALAGLYWLEEGKNTFGSADSNVIKLEGRDIPAQAGTFQYRNGTATLRAAEGAVITCNDEVIRTKTLRTDLDDKPDFVTIGSIVFVIIQRGANCLIRVWDRESPDRRDFTGLKHYPVNPAFRITARFVPYDPPRQIKIRDVIGEEYDDEFPGYAVFNLGGKECRLEASSDGEGGLFFNFYDPTNGNGSYPGGRFLDADAPVDREVLLDFNKSRNPPCAYSDYATCPLPPSQNRLPVRIPAGEMVYRHHHV